MKKYLRTLLFLFCLSVLCCTPPAQAQSVTDLNAEQLMGILTNPPAQFLVLDVRTAKEFHAGRINGALLADITQNFEAKLAPYPRTTPVLVYCRTGNRSAQAVKILRAMSFTRIYHFTGGMQAWEKAGLPVMR